MHHSSLVRKVVERDESGYRGLSFYKYILDVYKMSWPSTVAVSKYVIPFSRYRMKNTRIIGSDLKLEDGDCVYNENEEPFLMFNHRETGQVLTNGFVGFNVNNKSWLTASMKERAIDESGVTNRIVGLQINGLNAPWFSSGGIYFNGTEKPVWTRQIITPAIILKNSCITGFCEGEDTEFLVDGPAVKFIQGHDIIRGEGTVVDDNLFQPTPKTGSGCSENIYYEEERGIYFTNPTLPANKITARMSLLVTGTLISGAEEKPLPVLLYNVVSVLFGRVTRANCSNSALWLPDEEFKNDGIENTRSEVNGVIKLEWINIASLSIQKRPDIAIQTQYGAAKSTEIHPSKWICNFSQIIDLSVFKECNDWRVPVAILHRIGFNFIGDGPLLLLTGDDRSYKLRNGTFEFIPERWNAFTLKIHGSTISNKI
jgi:hypothetical protein